MTLHAYDDGAALAASWFNTPWSRKTYILEVSRKIDALWFAFNTALTPQGNPLLPATESSQFRRFYTDWERWLTGLSAASLLSKSTGEQAERFSETADKWAKKFEGHKVKFTLPPELPIPEDDDLAGKLATIMIASAVTAGFVWAIVKGPKIEKLPSLPKRKPKPQPQAA